MQRICDGILFESFVADDSWEVRTWQANGVLERSVSQCIGWREIGPCKPWDEVDPVKDAQWLLDKDEANLKRAARRAKQQCRRVIISEGYDELLTLTYKANQTDRELCKRHFVAWVRLMRKWIPGFRYCASFETQKRGALHVHLACHRLPTEAQRQGVKVLAWRLGTDLWRRVVGDLGGLCHVGAKTRYGASRRHKLSLAKMASYVSKYIMKDYADAPDNSQRYQRSQGVEISDVHVMRLRCSFREVIAVTFELFEGATLISHRLGRFGDSVWLCTEAPS